ncbi:MAG: 30S ribosomal protein S9, small subunit ribosomal protein S9 [candidate division WS6 bacterium GW2011_GWC1_33_20]|uniref:30S ribosomal protein S9 n=2 Tax=Candidatus Dojkabacteria TaxID=74243 RepID=A0A0G0CU69_9BACT|nr:MAG: 30S ribosomal protein S9, small subunit ribosomal protein S9 [candidate division WS6 bacterium GW2011_GWE2_33_157]KKP44538.1 MAG: 30S ribosomal protein S9, small subunit ribosomal protein S9 [candidate division WS6 bacterium GW2011_GWC1_33_20]KKP46152.1 MAG: 30S ribosomal protein S9, small subunit ribosomal protein S9 [candidate division WS6 bacterium GW2011_GWF1_33_233]KKP54635.1 MAG: 30S ribosomal protein S9 [candidate division WS6 bacterium GW2011_GWB1_33_6]KKP55416.1 MAG: 30S riboso
MKVKYFEGIGRRKTATARVRIYSGDKASMVNGKAVDTYFASVTEAEKDINKALNLTDLLGKFYFTAQVVGGGMNSQVDAIKLGLGRAIYLMDETLKPVLRKAGFVTRDPREVERKKYDHRKARKKAQFSKR